MMGPPPELGLPPELSGSWSVLGRFVPDSVFPAIINSFLHFLHGTVHAASLLVKHGAEMDGLKGATGVAGFITEQRFIYCP